VDERDQVVKNAIEKFTKQAKEYKHVIGSLKTDEEYVEANLKANVHHKEQKGNPAVPSLISKLRECYEETKGCPHLSLQQYLADQGYEGSNVDHVVSEVTNESTRINADDAIAL
jgi:hypothetical protein